MAAFLVRSATEFGTSYGTACASLISIVVLYVVLPRRSIISSIPGPPSPSWIFGHMLQLWLPPTYGDYEFNWQRVYGPFYPLKGCFGQDRLMVSDPGSLQYILNSPHFEYGPAVENAVRILHRKESIAAAKDFITGEYRKKLRAALNVGFTVAAVRNYRPVFEKAAQALTQQLEETAGVSIDICPLLSLATLSAISEAVLGYSTQDLGEEFISSNFRFFALASSQSAFQILADVIGTHLPTWIWSAAIHLPTPTFKTIRTAKYLSDCLGDRVVQEKIEAARKGLETNTDVFGLLLNLNRSDKNRNSLAPDEVVAQTMIITAAGQETTANTLALGLVELSRAPEFQEKLRAEIHSTLGYTRSAEVAYDGMPLLNAFIKEILRLYPAEAIVDRQAVQDTIIPLTDSLTTLNGNRVSEVSVRKGQ
ncbi:cytochrome P450, partial [Mycena leptocephala]